MPGVDAHAGAAQAMQPGAQQRRGLHVVREDAAAAADEGDDAQAFGPAAHVGGAEAFEPRPHARRRRSEAADEGLERLGMGEIQTAAPGQQELPTDRRHRVVEVDRDAGTGEHLGGHQPRRPAADDGDAHRRALRRARIDGGSGDGVGSSGRRKKYPAAATERFRANSKGDPMKTSSRAGRRIAALLAAALGGVGLCLDAAAQADAAACRAGSGRTQTAVVELYTSEGCSSCPPADRWLSRLKTADPGVVALAFHVDYWDRLGWKDRYASPAYTARQAQQQQSNGARFTYTPQVVVDGRDRTDWPSIAAPLGRSGDARVEAVLARDGRRVTASVTPLAGAPRQLAAYWAVTEQDHVSTVRAGENEGATLHHDFVVRAYRPVAAWAASPGAPASFAYELPEAADPAHERAVNLVVVDAATGRPVQAVKLGC